MQSANEIRQQFIDFFVKKHGHTFVPSSSVVPHDDPTLLFTNAGMNQFKDVFLGTGSRPYTRAVDTQKCIRAGGKHNDLDDVGKDTYHHTFFEMLGNWSFGDYFKKEAIQWAWELLTEVWKLDKTRLHATVFEGSEEEGVPPDDEAFELWKTLTDINPEHIHWGNKKDNFWEMGETGPCGPCTEVHYDRTPDKSGSSLVNKDSPDVIEIWNLVFIQFNRNEDRSLTPLPARHVDTGMGFERICAVIQGKSSNYDTDVFSPIIKELEELTGQKYLGRFDLNDVAFRVIADHIRMASFSIADGARPGNKQRDAVVRSVIRRAVTFAYRCFDQVEPMIYRLAKTVGHEISHIFPELLENLDTIEFVIQTEERDFLTTIGRGLVLFEQWAANTRSVATEDYVSGGGDQIALDPKFLHPKELELYHQAGKNVIPGEAVFRLHTTHGFPPDLTRQLAREQGLSIDDVKYRELMAEHELISRGSSQKTHVVAVQGDLPITDDAPKYKSLTAKGKIVGWVKENLVGNSGQFNAGDQIALLLDKTNFYAEQGGQVGDRGAVKTSTGTFHVEDTQRLGSAVLHLGRVYEGSVKVGQSATLEVDASRADTMRNHTATHLMNWALKKVLGDHVEQKGSLVDADKTRFDFSHNEPLTGEQIAAIERLVNERIYADLPVTPVTMPLEEAKQLPGVRAVFGEKYPDPVRVLMIGAARPADVTDDLSVEFCGGTHLKHTGEAGFFKIAGQELVSKGVRRLTAVTGREAVASVQRMAQVLGDLTERFRCKPEDISRRIDALQEENKKLQQQLKKGAASDLAGVADKLLESATKIGEAQVIVGEMPAGPDEQIRNQVDRMKQKAGSAVVVIGWADDGKVGLIAAATDDLVKKGVHAGKLIGQIAKLVGGGGGGRPNMAQAGGKEPEKLAAALEQAKELVKQSLAG